MWAAVPEGASSFWSWWSSTISHSGMCSATIAAARIISTAPIAKFGATKRFAGRPVPAAGAARSASGARSAPEVPTTQCTPAASASATFAATVSGCVKSTMTSASPRTSASATSSTGSARAASSIPSASSTARQVVSPILPAAPATTTLIGAPPGRRPAMSRAPPTRRRRAPG